MSTSFKNNHVWVPGWLSWLSGRLLTLAQVMISQFMRGSPSSGSLLSAQSLLRILSPSPSAPPLLVLHLSLSKVNKNTLKKKNKRMTTCNHMAISQSLILSNSFPLLGSPIRCSKFTTRAYSLHLSTPEGEPFF